MMPYIEIFIASCSIFLNQLPKCQLSGYGCSGVDLGDSSIKLVDDIPAGEVQS